MNILDRPTTLVLTKTWMPCGVRTAREAIVMMFSGDFVDGKRLAPAFAINFEYPVLDGGILDLSNPVSLDPVGLDKWLTLPIREHDDFICSAKQKIRVPTVVIAANFTPPKRGIMHTPSPTKRRIFERDKGVDQYTGKRVSFHHATLDHVIPKSRGGKNSFFNLVLAAPETNRIKADRTPEEAGMRLLKKPSEPPSVPVHATISNIIGCPDWEHFLIRKSTA